MNDHRANTISELLLRYLWLAICGCAVGTALAMHRDTAPVLNGSMIASMRSVGFVLQTAYLFVLPKLFIDIFERKSIWNNDRARDLGTVLVGLSIGVFYACWQALYGSNIYHETERSLLSFYDSPRVDLVSGKYGLTAEAWNRTKDLVGQAEDLISLGVLNDYALVWISICPLTSVATMKLLDKLRADYTMASFVGSAFFALPVCLVCAMGGGPLFMENPLLFVGTFFVVCVLSGLACGGVGMYYLWFVNSNWWHGSYPESPSSSQIPRALNDHG